MPLHDYRCPNGHTMEVQVPQGIDWITCGRCQERATKVFLKFPAAYVQADVCYDSPIDGRPITTKQARIEDLKRNHCRPYEPGEMEEVQRNREKAEEKFDKGIDETVEREVALMPQRKRELLEQEVRAGATPEIVRKDGTG